MKLKNYLLSDERYSRLCSELVDNYFNWVEEDAQ